MKCEWCRIRDAGEKKRNVKGRTIRVCDRCYAR